MEPGNPPMQSIRLPGQLRERIPYMHYSLATEKVYLYWVRFFVRRSARNAQMRHPRQMDAPEVGPFQRIDVGRGSGGAGTAMGRRRSRKGSGW